MNEQMEIGTIIKTIRINKGISGRFVANFVGINPTTLSKYENNHRRIKADLLPKFAEVLGVDVSIFFNQNIGVMPTPDDDSNMYDYI